MPRALLLSPDDQAVNAITGVLEEMSVSCERPLDAMTAAQKLNSHNFDLVLVDCENLPAAKLIFDVCRRGKGANNPVPIAIVDGRAGLPTAFRLGAELILTKPVAMDQARNTIRAAVGRVRREDPPRAIPSSDDSSVGGAWAQPEARAQAAAAASSTTSVVAGTWSPQPAKIAENAAGIAGTAPAAAKMSAAVEDVPNTPAAASPVAKPLFEASPKVLPGLATEPKEKLSNDPVLAEIDRVEKGEIVSELKVLSSFDRPQQKKGVGPVPVLLLVLAGGGFYAAWMYQPGFRELVQPQLNRVMAVADLVKQAIARPRPSPALPAAPASAPATDQPAANNNGAPPAVGDASSAIPPSEAPPALPSPDAGSEQARSPAETSKTTPAATPSENQSAADTNAVILSSKGAERRLVRQVPPAYPKEAKAAGLEGTVVLRTFVDDRGNVASVTLVEGDPMLADSATRAVKQWHYRPYARAGKALPFQTLVIVDFQRP